MVIVEPLQLVVGHQLQVQTTGVDWDQGEGIKAVELTVLSLDVLDHHHSVFGTNTMAAFGVDTRLDGDEHSFLQSDGSVAEVRWSLMDIEEEANAVTGAAAVV